MNFLWTRACHMCLATSNSKYHKHVVIFSICLKKGSELLVNIKSTVTTNQTW
jgi:hypothetical protein